MAERNWKLRRIINSHEQMKLAFHQLKSQIKFGLLEAEDVFASLSMPLMKLVGLKTEEMAQEGRFSTIVVDASDSTIGRRTNIPRSEMVERSDYAVNGGDQIYKLEDESYATKAMMVGKEFREKQKMQLIRLVHLLRQIETQVNTSQNSIIHTLAYHRVSLNKFFNKTISYISNLHQPDHNRDAYNTTLKLLQITFEQVRAALGSVESGVDGLMHDLAEQMCNPMVEYVKCLKAEMTNGTCQHLIALVEDMGVIMRDGRFEVEEARNKARAAEERKVEALSKLIESEERMKRMNETLRFLLEDKKSSEKPVVLHQENVEKPDDEKLQWEILKKKSKRKIPESPMGGEGNLFCAEPNKKAVINTTMQRPSTCHRPMTRSYSSSLKLNPQTPSFINTRLPLGLSPSATSNRRIISRKRISP